MARATLRELSRHTWPVATVWDSSDIKEHCHHCRKSHRPALLWTTPGAGCSHSSVPRHGGPCQQALLGARMCLVITSKLSPRSPVSGKQNKNKKTPTFKAQMLLGISLEHPTLPPQGSVSARYPPPQVTWLRTSQAIFSHCSRGAGSGMVTPKGMSTWSL